MVAVPAGGVDASDPSTWVESAGSGGGDDPAGWLGSPDAAAEPISAEESAPPSAFGSSAEEITWADSGAGSFPGVGTGLDGSGALRFSARGDDGPGAGASAMASSLRLFWSRLASSPAGSC